MKHALHTLALFIVAFGFTACAQLGLEPPKDFGDSLAYAYSQNTGFRQSATQALQVKSITVADANKALADTDKVRETLDQARKAGCPTAAASDPKPVCLTTVPQTALDSLKLASALLSQLQTFLNARGVK